jgi:hypothetical protein
VDTKDDLRAVDSIAAALRAIGGRKRPRMIDLTDQWAGKAFQILAAPGREIITGPPKGK